MTDIFDEIEEDLRAERAKQFARRYGAFAVAGAVVVLAGVGGWQIWQARQHHHSADAAKRYFAITRTLGNPMENAPTTANPKAEAAFAKLAATSPHAYGTLARLRAASLLAAAGKDKDAEAAYQQIAADGDADPLLRGLANLLWVELQVDHGDPAVLRAKLAPLTAEDSAWRSLAREAEALIDIREKQPQKAKDILQGLTHDSGAPDGLRQRATELLARLNR